MNKIDVETKNITEEQKVRLKELFPEAFTEQGVDFERLKNLLGDFADTSPERYSFTWPGKTEAIRASQLSSMGTLVPDKASSVDWNTTENLYLEGDNLEILKLLQKSYTGKVKMIYIDPPYNTGHDFVYPDKYGEGLKTYLEYTGQIDGEGKKLSTNTETDGRYHSKWLNMMYPRLMLARNLLKDDGVIFVSIDDHEVTNLRKIMDEIFGAENFVGDFIWRKKQGGGQSDDYFVTEHEYILVYKKTLSFVWMNEVVSAENRFNKEDEFGKFTAMKLAKWGNTARREDRPSMYFPIKDPSGKNVYPTAPDGGDGRWRVGKERMNSLVENNLIIWQDDRMGNLTPYEKIYYTDGDAKEIKDRSIIFDLAFTGTGTNILTELFGKKDFFENPKPVELIQLFSRNNTTSGDIILDFFSGSATTAHAMISLNAEDGNNRHFILTQLQEPTPENSEAKKAGYENIAEIGKERIRRAAKKILQENGDKINERETPLDTGFKVFRLTSSTFNVWDVNSEDNIQQKLIDSSSLIKGDAKEEDVLTELIIKSGYALTEKVDEITIGGKKIYSVAGGSLFISLSTGLTLLIIREIAEKKPMQFIAREQGFSGDDALTNTTQIMKDKGIDFRVL